MVALLLTLTMIVFVAIELFVARRAGQTASATAIAMREPAPPASVFLSAHHTWVRMTTEGSLLMGIDDLLAQLVGPIDSVWTPAPGTRLRAGDPLIRVQFEGRELTVPSPTAGVIERVNERILSAPWVLSEDAYRSGWAVSLRPDDYHAAVGGKRIGSEAREWLSEEFRRAVDFLSGTGVVRGAPPRGAVAALDPARFDEFERSFVRGV